MINGQTPRAFDLLREERNAAADAALAIAIPQMEPGLQAEAFQLLVDRGHPAGLGQVVGVFGSCDESLRAILLSRIGDLYGGVRHAISSTSLDQRISAIEIIECSREYKLVYLLGSVLRSSCSRSRNLAAAALGRMTRRHLEDPQDASDKDDPTEQAELLIEALRHGIMSWEAHVRPEILQAALSMGNRLEDTIREKLTEPRTNISHAISSLVVGSTDPFLAEFTLQSLAIPELRSAAVETISHTRDKTFVVALAKASWLLTDATIRRGCVRVRELRWLTPDADIFSEVTPEQSASMVKLIGATGLKSGQKVAAYRSVLGFEDPTADEAIVWELVADSSEDSTELLTMIANRTSSDLCKIAARELKRRGVDEFLVQQEADEETDTPSPKDTTPELWERFWKVFDRLSHHHQKSASAELRQRGFDILAALRAKLSSSSSYDRAKAIRAVHALGLVGKFEEETYRATSDRDPFVRSSAMSLLIDLPGVTTRRILQRALNDPDDRVQANAISVLDHLEQTGRREWIEPKLDSTNNRVRANAIKALLRMEFAEAGEVLLDMLGSDSCSSRLSALWVVERLGLQSLVARIDSMGKQDADRRVRQRAKRVFNGLRSTLNIELPLRANISDESNLPRPTGGAA